MESLFFALVNMTGFYFGCFMLYYLVCHTFGNLFDKTSDLSENIRSKLDKILEEFNIPKNKYLFKIGNNNDTRLLIDFYHRVVDYEIILTNNSTKLDILTQINLAQSNYFPKLVNMIIIGWFWLILARISAYKLNIDMHIFNGFDPISLLVVVAVIFSMYRYLYAIYFDAKKNFVNFLDNRDLYNELYSIATRQKRNQCDHVDRYLNAKIILKLQDAQITVPVTRHGVTSQIDFSKILSKLDEDRSLFFGDIVNIFVEERDHRTIIKFVKAYSDIPVYSYVNSFSPNNEELILTGCQGKLYFRRSFTDKFTNKNYKNFGAKSLTKSFREWKSMVI